MRDQIKLAIQIAQDAYADQMRWDGETPYIFHPEMVARALTKKGFREEIIATAWLHDVLEDTNLTEKDLRKMGVDPDIVDAVVMLTKNKDQSYLDYILSLKGHWIAHWVKMEDIRHNMSCFYKAIGSLYAKYELALYILESD